MHDPKARCRFCGRTHIWSVTAEKCRRVTERRWTREDRKDRKLKEQQEAGR